MACQNTTFTLTQQLQLNLNKLKHPTKGGVNAYKWLSMSIQVTHTHFSDSILITANKIQQYAGIYLLQNLSTFFGCPSHPSSGVHKTVTAASGTGHSIWAVTFLQRGQWPRWRKIVPETAVRVLCIPDDGFDGHPKHVEWFCSK